MNAFKELAQKQTTLSPVMEGRQKVDMNHIMQMYPNGITVTEFDFTSQKREDGTETTFPVLAFLEEPLSFFFGGTVLSNICRAWADDYDGDVKKASEDLTAYGGVTMRFRDARGKTGKRYMAVDII